MTDSKNKTVFAENLKRYMRIHRIDRNQLCSALDLKYTTVSEWLSGKKYPRIDKIELLANYFGVQKSDLIEERKAVSVSKNGVHRLSQELNIPFISQNDEFVSFPVLDEGAAEKGIPLLSQNFESVKIHSSCLRGKSRKEFLVLKISGDSMYPIYQKNDKVLIERKSTLKYSGQICVSAYGKEPSMLRKIEYDKTQKSLHIVSVNPLYQTVKIENCKPDDFRIIGIPKMLIREINE